ncbi:MAG: pirin family protein [Panacagrimonas sp.]
MDLTSNSAAVPPPALHRIEAGTQVLGEGMPIRRALPTRERRMIGPWCFLDHFGPVDVSHGPGMRVGPHPHIGLQTVTWLYEGEVLHRDSLGYVQAIRPGQLNLMTSGQGISHSEESPAERPAGLHGVQFWIALPDTARSGAPAFDHHAQLPSVRHEGLDCTVLVGSALGMTSPARMQWPVVGLDVSLGGATEASLPLDTGFEHAMLVTQGRVDVEGETLEPGTLLYLGGQRDRVRLRADKAARLVLIGGRPFEEPMLMWWNFVARSKQELSAACREWNHAEAKFGEVKGYDGNRLAAPMPPWA